MEDLVWDTEEKGLEPMIQTFRFGTKQPRVLSDRLRNLSELPKELACSSGLWTSEQGDKLVLLDLDPRKLSEPFASKWKGKLTQDSCKELLVLLESCLDEHLADPACQNPLSGFRDCKNPDMPMLLLCTVPNSYDGSKLCETEGPKASPSPNHFYARLVQSAALNFMNREEALSKDLGLSQGMDPEIQDRKLALQGSKKTRFQ